MELSAQVGRFKAHSFRTLQLRGAAGAGTWRGDGRGKDQKTFITFGGLKNEQVQERIDFGLQRQIANGLVDK